MVIALSNSIYILLSTVGTPCDLFKANHFG